MELRFNEMINRNQCGAEFVLDGFQTRCRFASSRTVTIPEGLHYFDGRLDFSRSGPGATMSICKNHEMRLKNAFRELLEKN